MKGKDNEGQAERNSEGGKGENEKEFERKRQIWAKRSKQRTRKIRNQKRIRKEEIKWVSKSNTEREENRRIKKEKRGKDRWTDRAGQ